MRKTILPKLNHKPQGVCEENEEEIKKNNCWLKYYAVKGLILETCRRTVTQLIAMIFATRILFRA